MRVSLSRKPPVLPAQRSFNHGGLGRGYSRRSYGCSRLSRHPANTAALPSRQLPCEP